MSMESAKETFLQEATDLLTSMEDALLSLEEAPDDPELLHLVFRAMHTIKGTAGVFGFDPVVHFTHTAESVMDDVRSGGRELDAELIAVLLDCKDHTAALVDAVLEADDPTDISAELQARGDDLIRQLTGETAAPETGSSVVPSAGGGDVEKIDAPA